MKKLLLGFVLCACVLTIGATTAIAEEAVAPTAEEIAEAVEALNNTVSAVSYSGFGYQSARVLELSKIKMFAVVIREAQKDLPAGYQLVITGHNDKYEKNSSVGYQRAKAVMYELRGFKLNTENVVCKNAKASELLEDVNGGKPEQRRVTFSVVKK